MIGTSLAHYEIVSLLGEGGMGRVFRARDTRLGRDVALKLLPPGFTEDPDRLARFEREARTLAQLQHPNIASIYGFEQDGDHRFLVMELAEGQDLAERLTAGPLSVETALDLARQIALGLEAAHDKSITHRDLKPANVMIGVDGQAKILDFGLAKAASPEKSGSHPATSLSPTMTAAATAAGMIMGTAAYMSPEQARGKPVDARSDVWAFGCLLYEMLAGRRLFEGETVSDLLAAVLKTDPDWSLLPAETPPAVRRLLRRCLQRDPQQRLHHLADARLEIAEALEAPEVETAEPGSTPGGGRRLSGAMLLAAVTVALLLGAAGGWLLRSLSAVPASAAPIYRLAILPPDDTTLDLDSSPSAAVLSPDGNRMVFGALDEDGVVRLYVRELGGGTALPLSGTEDAQYPFWSPDSRWVGFFQVSSAALKKVRARGGPPVRVCEALNGKGASWSADDVIVFAPTFGSPIHRVDAAGGASTPVTRIDATRHNSHRHPRFLEDGRHFVFLARSNDPGEPGAVMIGSLDATETQELLRSNTQAEVTDDYLLLEQDGVIQARAFDMRRLAVAGDPVPLAEGVAKSTGASFAGFSSGGAHLAFNVQAEEAPATLEMRGRDGEVISVLGEPGYFLSVLPSPDGRRAVLTMEEGWGGAMELWMQDLETELRTRLTFEAGDQFFPAWSPDSTSVYYASNHESGQFAVYRRDVGQIGQPTKVLESDTSVFPMAITPEGAELVYMTDIEGAFVLRRQALGSSGAEPRDVLAADGLARAAVLSPDGRFLAYVSDESGRREVYVTDFPDARRRALVSSRGGSYPIWSSRGDRLLFRQGRDEVLAVPVHETAGDLVVGAAELLTRARVSSNSSQGSAAALLGDGERILVVHYPETPHDSHIGLVLNWRQAMAGRR